MNVTRAAFWTLGIAFVLGGVYMLYFEAGLDRWVSFGVLMAGFLVFIGLAVMGFSTTQRDAVRGPVASRTMVIESPPSVVRDREVREVIETSDEVYAEPLRAERRRRPARVASVESERRTTRPGRTVRSERTGPAKRTKSKRRVLVDDE